VCTIVIWGAGKIGRGFIADLFNRAGYGLHFIDANIELVNQLKEKGRYTILNYRSETDREEVEIKRFGVYHTSEKKKIINLMAEISLASIAVHPSALQEVSRSLSLIIKERVARRMDKPLDIIICANVLHPASIIKEKISQHLNSKEWEYFEKNVGLVDSLVIRTAPEPAPEMKEKEPLVVLTNGYPYLPVDKKAFRGKIPDVYGIKPVKDIEAQEVRKLYTYNMVHALLAYIGKQKGYEYIFECLSDPAIRKIAESALKEISLALEAEYGFTHMDMTEWNNDLMKNMANPILKDRLDRVGADPIRKLKRNDRLVGPALLCLKHGIKPQSISRAIATAFKFQSANDFAVKEIHTYLNQHTPEEAVTRFCQLEIDREPDKTLLKMIIHYY